MPVLSFPTKNDLIEALEATRPYWTKVDDLNMRRHKAEEKATLEGFRARCKTAAKMTYAQLQADDKARGKYASIHFSAPSCPVSEVAKLDRCIKQLNLTHQKQFNVEHRGRWDTAWHLLNGPILAATTRDLCK